METGGDDRLVGGGDANDYVGGRGRDLFDGRPNGGVDDDSVRYELEEGPQGVVVNLDRGIAKDSFGHRDQLLDIESVFGTAFADRLLGGQSQRNLDYQDFVGLAGANSINGGNGFDLLRYDRDIWYGGDAGVVVDLRKGAARDGFGD